MTKKTRIKDIAGKALVLILTVCVVSAGLFYLDGQTSVAPENPLTELLERDRMSVAEAATLDVDERILDENVEVTNATSEVPSDEAALSDVRGSAAGEVSGGSGDAAGTHPSEGAEKSQIEIILDPDNGNYFNWYEAVYQVVAYTNPCDIDLFQVKCNGAYVFGAGSDGSTYRMNLRFGENSIEFFAESEELGQAYRRITVVYMKPTGLRIETNLGQISTVYDPDIEFYADVIGSSPSGHTFRVKQVRSAVSATLSPYRTEVLTNEEGEYTRYYFATTLNGLGKSTFTMIANDYYNEPCVWGPYSVTFTRDPNQPPPPEYPSPRLTANVYDGMKTDSSPYRFQISAIDGYGNTIFQSAIYVDLNGVRYHLSEEMPFALYFYVLQLKEGENSLKVTVRTPEEYYYYYNYTIYYKPAFTQEPIGTIYVSVDANTVGLGELASGEVPIYSEQPTSYAVVRLLEQFGYQANVSGTLDTNMYLKHVYKPGITNGFSVPTELLDELTRTYPDIWHGEYVTDSLGEFNFTNGSGWMITVNDVKISGLSHWVPSPGDIVRVRYTLAFGSDIGLSTNNFTRTW